MKNVLFLKALLLTNFIIVLGSCTDKNKDKSLEGRLKNLQENTIQTSKNPLGLEVTVPKGPFPIMQFSSIDHDFGIINEGDLVENVFEFTNSGTVPLIINGAAYNKILHIYCLFDTEHSPLKNKYMKNNGLKTPQRLLKGA